MKAFTKAPKGFTLIEILVVIGIIAVLAAIVIIAINPARQFAQARNTQRTSNLNTILNAMGQHLADNKGLLNCASIVTPIPTTSALTIGIGTTSPMVDLSCLVPTYIPSALPTDPDGGLPADTKYTIQVDTLGRYTVCAPKANEPALSSPGPVCVTR